MALTALVEEISNHTEDEVDASLLLRDYVPESQLVVPVTEVTRARYAAIDAHNHLRTPSEDATEPSDVPARLVAKMDEHNLRAVVDLDGFVSGRLERALHDYKGAYPGRFAVLAQLDWAACREPGWPDALVGQIEAAIAVGADGLKIGKSLGLELRDEHSRLIAIDDLRLSDLWEVVAEAGLPVLIHVADPVAFFRPLDNRNERRDELSAYPQWSFSGTQYPPFERLMEQLIALVERHPRTIFQMAHVGGYAENLGFVGERLLRPHPNVYVDISERIAELGRQPYSARRFFLEFQDRILFGSDRPPTGPWYPYYFRFLETWDEYFPHGPEQPPRQGRWNIYGIGLPDAVLAKVYCANAERLYPSLRG